MDDDLYSALSDVRPPIETSATLPPACYSAPHLAEIERRAIFRSSWVGLGRHDQWKSPGDYSTIRVTDVPLIVIRDLDQTLRAFSNSCRHRGSELLEGSGNVKAITCPFHCWRYDLTGELRVAPNMPKDETFDKSSYGLIEFSVAERDGFAFVCLGSETDELNNWLGDFSTLHAPWSLDELVSTRHREFEVECDWKGFLEVFNEYYHLPMIHPNSINSVYAHPDPADPVTGNYASQFGETEGTGGLLETMQEHALPAIPTLEGRNRRGTRYSWIYPNMTFAAGSEAVWVYVAMPFETGRCHVQQTVCFPKEIVERDDFDARAQTYYDRMDAALAEDIPALERHQRGLASPFALPGRYCTSLEPNVANFGIWYAGRMRAALDHLKD